MVHVATESATITVRGVTFDLDDTLWCGKTVIRKATAAFHAYLAQEMPQLADQFPPAAFDALLVEFQRVLPDKAHDYTFLRKYTLRHCVEACGAQKLHLQDTLKLEAFVDGAFRAFLVPRSQPELFDGVESLFQGLKREIERSGGHGDVPMLGVITNGNCEVENLPKYFQDHVNFMISAELVGSPKPGRAIFDAAVTKFPASYSRQHLVHVGDHYECDVEGAKRAGMRTIWVNASWTKPDALTRADLTREDAEQYAAADAIVKEVNAVLLVVERWNSLAAAETVMPE
ncbi:Haloacid dehalogenase-like hydrolase [Phytophthora palmivora]|uniref:Haloacid dehalogenase-like hydrolase n=1 Tax=Phytophthora palmivora TaxID=4796 RepID=A0A2P4YTN6_9STRA|nr:Haloacid dehalogenase-like hydrolase [Phytophthora palmivora]